MKHILFLLVFIVGISLISGCTGPHSLLTHSPNGDCKNINWSVLWPIILDAASSQQVRDTLGINKILGEKHTQTAFKIVDALKLGYQVYQGISRNSMSRDIRVTEIISQYQKKIS